MLSQRVFFIPAMNCCDRTTTMSNLGSMETEGWGQEQLWEGGFYTHGYDAGSSTEQKVGSNWEQDAGGDGELGRELQEVGLKCRLAARFSSLNRWKQQSFLPVFLTLERGTRSLHALAPLTRLGPTVGVSTQRSHNDSRVPLRTTPVKNQDRCADA